MEPQSSLVDEGAAAFDIFKSSKINAAIYQSLEELFKEKLTINVIKCVSRNIKLFRLFNQVPGEKFIRIEDALSSLAENSSHENVLIHFTELKLYGLFTPNNYTTLIQNMQERFENDPNISFRPQQIILTGLPQKLIFICLGDDTIVEKIRGYVAKKYKCEIKSVKMADRIEITVQGVGGNSYDEVQKSYHDLLQWMGDDDKVRQKILPMPIQKFGNHNYVTADLSCDLSQHNSLIDVISSLKTVHGGGIVVNLTIVNGTCNIGTTTIGVQNNKIKSDKKQQARNWVLANPPKDKEPKFEYYERYKSEVKDFLPSATFTQIVEENKNFTSCRSNNVRYWNVK